MAIIAILAIGSTATTNVHAQVDCSANPDDPSCQGSSDSTDNSGSSSSNTQTTTCPDGSQPDSNGNCPRAQSQQKDNPIVSAGKNYACNIIAGAAGAAVGGALGSVTLPIIGTVHGATAGAAAAQGLCK